MVPQHGFSRTLSGRWEPPPPDGKKTFGDTSQHHENNLNNSQNDDRRYQKQKRHQQKSNNAVTQPLNNKKIVISPDETTTVPMEAEVPKLDPDNPDHARRIRQRRRQVLFGKNTAGYEEYIKKVPKHKRKFKCLEHPQTPDHLADIPTKRWQGQINAWRRSLHVFDPPDLASRKADSSNNKMITLAPRPCTTEQDKIQEEIAQAKASGLQVAFDSMIVGKEAALFSLKVAAAEEEGEEGDDEINQRQKDFYNPGDALFDEEEAYQTRMNDSGFLEQACESDSDDDLL